MKLAVNYSEALLSLIQADPSLPVDCIKVPTEPFPGSWRQFERGKRFRPLLPHLAQAGIITLGHPDPALRFHEPSVLRALRESSTDYLSTHLEAKVDYFPDLAAYQHQLEPAVEMRLREHYRQAIREVRQRLPVPLVIENYPYYKWGWHYRLASEPWFIAELCASEQCGFLLDIAHARCTAWSMGIALADLLAALPLERVREIHLAGTWQRKEGIIDTHTALEEADYQLFRDLLRKTNPEVVSIEYGGMPDRIQNIQGDVIPISRNDPEALRGMIERVTKIIR